MTSDPRPITGNNIDLHLRADAPQIVTISPFWEDHWFAVLDVFMEYVPLLSGADVKVMLFFFYHRCRNTYVVSDCPQSRICTELALSPAQVSTSIKVLCSVFDLDTRKALFLEAMPNTRTSWRVSPAVRFKGARVRPIETPDAGVQPIEREVQPAEPHFSRLKNPGLCTRETRARFGSEIENLVPDNNSQKPEGDAAVVVRLLLAAQVGFSEGEARAIARMPAATPRQVQNAIAGAIYTRDQGKLKIGPRRDESRCMRAWIIRAVSEQWNLFDQVAADEHAAKVKAKAASKAVDDLRERLRGGRMPEMPSEECAAVIDALGGWEAAVQALPTSWRSLPRYAVGERLKAAAARGAA